MPLADVYRLTTPWQQCLPLGYAGTMASLGGLLVTNTSGIKRLRYGGVRDLLLGVRVALPDGSQARFGGRVVKNVAGYDMNKLFLGSLGAFGVVLETTYRLVALPEDDRVLAVLFPTLAQASAAAAALRQSALLPAALLLLHADAAAAWAQDFPLTVEPAQVALLLNYDGTHAAVTRQIRDSRMLCTQYGSLVDTTLAQTTLPDLWALREQWCQALPVEPQSILHLRLGVLPTHMETLLTSLAQPLAWGQEPIPWVADAAYGQIWAQVPVPTVLTETDVQAVQSWLHTLRIQAQSHQGYVVVESAPAMLQAQLDVWGPSSGALLLALYKQRFDPHGVLNPGRYMAGL